MHLRHWLSAFGYPSGVTSPSSGLFVFHQSFLLFFYFNSSESLGRMQMRLSVCTSQSRPPPVQYLFESSDRAFFFIYLDSARHGQHSSKHGFYMASRAAPFRPCGLPVVPRVSLVGSKYNTRPSRRRRCRRSGLNKLGPGLAWPSLSSLRPYCLRHDEAEDMTT